MCVCVCVCVCFYVWVLLHYCNNNIEIYTFYTYLISSHIFISKIFVTNRQTHQAVVDKLDLSNIYMFLIPVI